MATTVLSNKMPPPHYVELVGKVVDLLEVLRDEPSGLPLRELSSRAGMVKSSAHRILRSLMVHGYVEQEANGGKYGLGVQCLTLARGFSKGMDLLRIARPYLREILEAFGETTYLAVRRRDHCLFVDVQETHRDLRLVGPLGAEVHYHATAAGKAIAAFLRPEDRSAVLDRLEPVRVTNRTLTDRALVEREWERVRRCGFAINDEETITGAVFLAAPIFDSREEVCASISIGMPKARYSQEAGERMPALLKDACRRLSATLHGVEYVSHTAATGRISRHGAF
jgi:IclR family transcriptional regulator, KDG regulon repressor